MKRFISVCVFTICSVAIGVRADDRVFIELFPYASVNNADPTAVRKLLLDRLQRLAEETISANPQLGRLNKIKVIDKKDPLPGSPEDLANYWTNSRTTLEILSGSISNNPSFLTSNIYLGDLQGSLKTRTVTAQIPLTAEELRSYRDMHGALMLYALAMDAKRRHDDNGVVSQYLAETESLLRDLNQRTQSPIDADRRALSTAVAAEIALLKR
jgi:hypothetical protein